jgi:hypothetical protein
MAQSDGIVTHLLGNRKRRHLTAHGSFRALPFDCRTAMTESMRVSAANRHHAALGASLKLEGFSS